MQLEAIPAEPTAKKTCTPARWSDEIASPASDPDAIRRNQTQSDAIRRNQTQSLACFRSRRDLELERLLHRDRA